MMHIFFWNNKDAVPCEWQDGKVRLQGEKTWDVEIVLANDEQDDIEYVIDRIVESIPEFSHRVKGGGLQLNFGNSVGIFPVEELGQIEVFSGKWTEQHFNEMLKDVSRIASNLPFSAESSGSLPFDRSVVDEEDIAYHAFVYLRYILSDKAPPSDQLMPALQAILKNPHRRLNTETCEKPLECTSRMHPNHMVDMIHGKGGWTKVTSISGVHPSVIRAFRDNRTGISYLPSKANEHIVRDMYDTPENRFVRAFLDFADGVIEKMRWHYSTQSKSKAGNRILEDCSRIEQLLIPVKQHSLWESVGRMVHFPASSTVLQRRVGYREVLRHYVNLRLSSRIPLNREEVFKLLELKDIALLYEIWCYFQVVEAINEILGQPTESDSVKYTPEQAFVDWKYRVRWPDGISAYYNLGFYPGSSSWKSYSVNFRPDIVLKLPDSTHIFDAKFRVDLRPDAFSKLDADSDVLTEIGGKYKHDDICKMHTYKDALEGVNSAWVLYPGDRSFFYTINGTQINLQKHQISSCDGVGAVSLTPGIDNRLLKTVIDQLMSLRHEVLSEVL